MPTISINDKTVTEGNSGTSNATFTVTLSANPTQPVTVHYATLAGTATEGNDYVATSGDLVFPASGGTTQNINVPIKGDIKDDKDEKTPFPGIFCP